MLGPAMYRLLDTAPAEAAAPPLLPAPLAAGFLHLAAGRPRREPLRPATKQMLETGDFVRILNGDRRPEPQADRDLLAASAFRRRR